VSAGRTYLRDRAAQAGRRGMRRSLQTPFQYSVDRCPRHTHLRSDPAILSPNSAAKRAAVRSLSSHRSAS
jgi:hypothetical protein